MQGRLIFQGSPRQEVLILHGLLHSLGIFSTHQQVTPPNPRDRGPNCSSAPEPTTPQYDRYRPYLFWSWASPNFPSIPRAENVLSLLCRGAPGTDDGHHHHHHHRDDADGDDDDDKEVAVLLGGDAAVGRVHLPDGGLWKKIRRRGDG